MADDRQKLMIATLNRYRERRGWVVNNIELWAALCGRHTGNYGPRMPDNLTEHALIMGVLVS